MGDMSDCLMDWRISTTVATLMSWRVMSQYWVFSIMPALCSSFSAYPYALLREEIGGRVGRGGTLGSPSLRHPHHTARFPALPSKRLRYHRLGGAVLSGLRGFGLLGLRRRGRMGGGRNCQSWRENLGRGGQYLWSANSLWPFLENYERVEGWAVKERVGGEGWS